MNNSIRSLIKILYGIGACLFVFAVLLFYVKAKITLVLLLFVFSSAFMIPDYFFTVREVTQKKERQSPFWIGQLIGLLLVFIRSNVKFRKHQLITLCFRREPVRLAAVELLGHAFVSLTLEAAHSRNLAFAYCYSFSKLPIQLDARNGWKNSSFRKLEFWPTIYRNIAKLVGRR